MSWELGGLESKASLGLVPLSIFQEPHGLSVLASLLFSDFPSAEEVYSQSWVHRRYSINCRYDSYLT